MRECVKVEMRIAGRGASSPLLAGEGYGLLHLVGLVEVNQVQLVFPASERDGV